ncbi:MAG: DUF1572 domain-containing protein [Acidobacteriia bacterium]|nr:DUF1572 domain-containing protein [Terriglobia bacterium]
MNPEIGVAFLEESKNRAIKARERINHCLGQLEDEDIWWTPGEGSNSLGVIIQHLMGNLRQWILSGVGGEADVRDRPREFRVEVKTPKAELRNQFNNVLDQVDKTFSRLDPLHLLERKRIQGFDESALSAIYQTMTHLELHAGQIAYITKMRKGRGYDVSWKPVTKEQGA